MKRLLTTISSVLIFLHSGFCQVKENSDMMILFRGLIRDASTFSPISNAQIIINREFSSVTDADGSFAFYVKRNDTIIFSSMGYKKSVLHVSDTLRGQEFISGIYMNSDTLSIPEVIIVPRYSNIRSQILNAKSKTPAGIENARYNVAISAYQGKHGQNQLGDPIDNYSYISHKQKIDAFEKGGIPSDQMVGFSPLIFIPAAYLLMHGLPESTSAFKPQLTEEEVEQLHNKYMESVRGRK